MLKNINLALLRINNHSINTPLEFSERLSNKYNCEVFLKREDLQKTRSFKIRGSLNNILKNYNQLDSKEIICASAGNHAQGVAYSCNLLGLKGKIFCPITTPLQKLNRITHFGKDNITLKQIGNSFNETLNISKEYCNKVDGLFVHPFDDIDIIEGQATIGIEINDKINDLDIVLGSIGGGGLMSGVGSFFKKIDNNIKIYGVEPLGAESMTKSFQNNEVITMDNIDNFVDGASIGRVGALTYEICKNVLDDIFVVNNGRICNEMLELYNKDGIIVEPAGCLSICGLDYIDNLEGKKVVCIVSGGNNDISRYPEILEKNDIFRNQK
jgi:threonine dehydratase